MLMTWLKKRRAEQRKELSERGYDFAAGALLRGTSPESLEALTDNCFDRNEFDAGITDALRDWARAQSTPQPTDGAAVQR